jgi:16S rRNA G966 N2-methylase RsmD
MSALQDGLAGYMGAKTNEGLWQAILALMPPHDTYIEAFAGSAAIYRRKAPAGWSVLLEKDPAVAARLQAEVRRGGFPNTIVPASDALAWLSRFPIATAGRTVVYADPPYVLATRTSSRRYRHDFTDDDHRALALVLAHLAEQGVAIILSGYPSALYDELYEGWNTREFQVMTRGGARTEKLWFNFEPGAAHWSTFAGRNRTHRQQIKRKAARWAAKFQALPAAERQAVLAALLELGEIPRSRK